MSRSPCNPKTALDYPRIDDGLYIIWTGNEHVWPDARRETHYLSDRRDIMRGYALFTPFPNQALTFERAEDAQEFLEGMNTLRPRPYHNVQVTTVAEMKIARGYEAPEEQDSTVSPSP